MKLLGFFVDVVVDFERNEVYVVDGYGNWWVIVFDVDMGAYRCYWGVYGAKFDDSD